MTILSKGKLEFFKFRKKYTNQKISELTEIPISNVNKIFGGYNKNPTFETISKIANILECTIDDLTEDDKGISPYYTNKILSSMAIKINNSPNLKQIFESLQNLNEEDFKSITYIVTRLSEINNKNN